MQRALIIGAAGQDGRLLAELLSRRAYSVRGWTRREPSCRLPCQHSVINILHEDRVAAGLQTLKPIEIYYLAAFHHSAEDRASRDTIKLLRRSFDVHVTGLLNVLEAMRTCSPRPRLFYASSSHIFGAAVNDWQSETTPLRPDSPYAISKAAGLRCCQIVRQQEGLFAATGILFNHESALRKPTFVSQRIVQGALKARQNPNFRVKLGDLDARVDWGYAADYVDAMWRILQLPEAGDFVIASGQLHSVREFVETAFDRVGLNWRDHIEIDRRRIGKKSHPKRGNSQKLQAATGWSPSLTFSEMVVKLIQEAERNYARV